LVCTGDLVFVEAGSAVEVAEAAGDAAADVAGMGYRSRWLRAGGASGGTDVSGFPIPAVSFKLDGSSVANDPSADGTATARSVDSAALGAGSYTYSASVAGNINYLGATSDDEPLTVDKADTTVPTHVHDSDHTDVTNTNVAAGEPVHDSATLSGQEDSFSFNGTATVTYYFYANSTCTGSPASTEVVTVAADDSVPESTPQTLAVGSYCYQAVYSGNDDYNGSTRAIEPFQVIQKSIVTDSALCTFDVDEAEGNQFRLIFTPDMNAPTTWKLNASNPGQYYYNVFFNDGTEPNMIYLEIPYPFVTQGATPIHIYSEVTTTEDGGVTCLIPGTEIGHQTDQVTLADYNATNLNYTDGGLAGVGFGDTVKVAVDFTSLTGFAYVNIHLDYGLKGTLDCSKGGSNQGICTTPPVTIPDYQSYTFSVHDGISDSATVSSHNVFKRDPGIAGLIQREGTGEPVAGVEVRIADSAGNPMATVFTDQDGFYMWLYKYTGKPTTFTVSLPGYPTVAPQTVTMKSNKFIIVNFTVPQP
jgi:hypothetical protein